MMIDFGYFESLCEYETYSVRNRKRLSIIILTRFPEHKEIFTTLISDILHNKDIEIIILVEYPKFHDIENDITHLLEPVGAENLENITIIKMNFSIHLKNLKFDIGIKKSNGDWYWLIDLDEGIPTIPIEKMLQKLIDQENTFIFNVTSRDATLLREIPGVKTPWIDMFYKGIKIPLQNVLIPRTIFNTRGLFDPHICMTDLYIQEFFIRCIRYIQTQTIVDDSAINKLEYIEYPAFFPEWADIERDEKLIADSISSYLLDDLDQYQSSLSIDRRWNLYLNYVVRFYANYRHLLPEFTSQFIQSFPVERRRIYCVKGDYETSTDVGFRNFDLLTKGNRYQKLIYSFLGFFNLKKIDAKDTVLLLRAADNRSLEISRECINSMHPVGYAMDDDLIHFYKYGGNFTAFQSGNPSYDAMIEIIKTVDVVLCGGSFVVNSVKEYNSRTIQFEGSILPDFLPQTAQLQKNNKPFRFGYAGGSYRSEEFNLIWPAIERICDEYKDDVQFEFWGLNPKDIPARNVKQIKTVPFSINYYEYLNRLKCANFSAMLIPLCLNPTPKRGKLPNKLYEAACAGAVGIYSNVPAYNIVKEFQVGLLAKEDEESWYQAMKKLLELSETEYKDLQLRCNNFVREFYSTAAMLPKYEACIESIVFHGSTRENRCDNGKPLVMFVFPVISGTGGGEIVLRRRMELLIKVGIQPLVVVPEYVKTTLDWLKFKTYLEELSIPYDSAYFRSFVLTPPLDDVLPLHEEETSIKELFTRHKVALVHSGGYIPALGSVCSELDLPHIVAHYGVDEQYQWPMGKLPYIYCDIVHSDSIRYAKKWAELFDCEWKCLRDVSTEELFTFGFNRLFGSQPEVKSSIKIGIIGTLFPRKSQFEAIQAISLLKYTDLILELYLYGGTDADPDYVKKCKHEVDRLGIGKQVFFMGHVVDLVKIYQDLDIVMCVSTFESFPTAIKEATSFGNIIISSQVGGVKELIKDGINGFLLDDVSPEEIAKVIEKIISLSPQKNLEIRRNAFRLACQEFHPRKGLADLLALYNSALVIHQQKKENERKIKANKGEPIIYNLTGADKLGVHISGKIPNSDMRILKEVRYFFVPSMDNWSRFDVFLGTHMRKAEGQLKLKIATSFGLVIRESIKDLSNVEDNNWIDYCFENISNSKGKTFIISFSLENPGEGTRISIYETSQRKTILKRIIQRIKTVLGLPIYGEELYFREWFSKGNSNPNLGFD